MSKAIIIEEFGGPEVMKIIESRNLPPNDYEVTIRNTAIGLNCIDTYHRTGLYPIELPSCLGLEGSAVITDLGKNVEGFHLGDRVAYVGLPIGAYSEQRNYPADGLIKIPESISNELAAASMLKGLTAWYLANKSYPLKTGDDVLIYAAAGGVGLFLSQWAKHLGARVIGIVSTSEKAELALLNGCTEVLYADDIAKEIMNTNPQIQNKLQEYFGSKVLHDTNKINKYFLRQEIFNSDTKRLWLNKLIHPIVWEIIKQRACNSKDYVIAEIPLILENNNQDKVNKIIVVDCSIKLQIQRASLRDGINNTEILKIIY